MDKAPALLALVFFVSTASGVYLGSYAQVRGEVKVVPPIQISEVNFDAFDEGGGEYIEVYNAADREINLSDWEVAEKDDSESLSISAGGGVVEPGEYALIVENSSYSSKDFTVLRVDGFGLANSGDKVSILDPEGNSIDSYNYTEDTDCPESKTLQAENGYLERSWVCATPTPGGGPE